MTYLVPHEKKDDDQPPDEDEEEDDSVTFDQTPVRVVCPHCGLNIITFIEHEASWVTYAVSITLLLVLNWAALCVVPVVYPLFKDVVHHCPRCLSVLATRSRVAITSFKGEVMSCRFGSCVVVLARKYVIMLLVLVALIAGVHFARGTGSARAGVDALAPRGMPITESWEDFIRDCGYKSYLGNPIHVTMAFNERYKNKTVEWEGAVHHIEEGLNLLWWSQKGAVYVRMQPPQFPHKKDMADLLLVYEEGGKVGAAVQKLKRGSYFGFQGTLLEVGRRGAPHVMTLWQVRPADPPKVASEAGEKGSSGAGNATAPAELRP